MHNRIGHRFGRRLDVPNWLEPKTPGAEWSPLDISGLAAWYACRLETVYSDTDPITSWTDQSGNGNHATPGSAPTFRTGILNGLPIARFDGAANHLFANALVAIASGDDQPFSVFFVGDLTAISNFDYFWTFGNSGNNTPWHAYQSRTGIGFSSLRTDDVGGTITISPPANNYDELPHIHGLIFTGGLNTEGRLDGAQAFLGNQNVGVMTVDRFTIGALGRIAISGHIAVDIAEMVVVDGAMSDDERDNLEVYLNGFYAIY